MCCYSLPPADQLGGLLSVSPVGGDPYGAAGTQMASDVMQGKHTSARIHEDLCVDNLSASFLA